ncbi:alpha/beta hydrolase [Chloroflexota bacterium]
MSWRAVTLKVDGIDIAGRLYRPGGPAPHPTVCICHGIPAGQPEPDDGGYPELAESICRHGLAVFIFNFRGTGASGGNFDILGWTRDLGAVIDYLWTLPEVDRSYLALLGFSGGAAVSVYVAAREERVSAVAACACPADFALFSNEPQPLVDHFRSIGAIRDNGFPASAADWFGGFKVITPIEHIAGIAPRPLLLVHGDRDETVAVADASRLYARAGEPKQLVIVNGAGHRLRQNAPAMAAVTDWLNSLRRG